MTPTTSTMNPCNTRFLLKFKDTILDSITTIVNQSLTTGTFLEDWNISSVRLLIKGLNLDTELINYRPISNISFFIQNNEKEAQTQQQNHFDNQSFLPKHQSAYRQNFSKEITLLNMCDNILKIWKIKNVHQWYAWTSVLGLTQ